MPRSGAVKAAASTVPQALVVLVKVQAASTAPAAAKAVASTAADVSPAVSTAAVAKGEEVDKDDRGSLSVDVDASCDNLTKGESDQSTRRPPGAPRLKLRTEVYR